MKCSTGLQMSQRSWTVCLVGVVLLMGTAHGCFIRNCPRGGKRALDTVEVARECMACGPRGMGRCVGPAICCGPYLGCLMGTAEAEVCRKENESPTPCAVRGQPCGADNAGNCVADGLCCSEDACSSNDLCKGSDQDTGATRQNILALIKRLLNRQ